MVGEIVVYLHREWVTMTDVSGNTGGRMEDEIWSSWSCDTTLSEGTDCWNRLNAA